METQIRCGKRVFFLRRRVPDRKDAGNDSVYYSYILLCRSTKTRA